MSHPKTALIIGAGPAGLTAAYELLQRTGVRPLVLEQSHEMGGISRTVNYKGNRIDIGGHRFFSKSDRVMRWWLNMLPPEEAAAPVTLQYQNQRRPLPADAPVAATDPTQRFLIRPRKSRIFFLRRFFDYPLKLSADTLAKLGLWRTVKIGLSYLRSMAMPIKPERTLEEFFINRFGRQLYRTFFQSYTEKVWGVPCREISAEWGAQRIKGLSILTALRHMVKKLAPGQARSDLAQKNTETSLIEQFLYPAHGPGQLWETVAKRVQAEGGEILTGWTVDRLIGDGTKLTAVEARHESGERRTFQADYVFSTMPVKELVRSLSAEVPSELREISEGLQYRDFITVGLLLDELKVKEETPQGQQLLKDNWIYIQEPDVLVGRMQIFNNWSPHLVADPTKVWVGLEYFCYETDAIWKQPDADMIALAVKELQQIGMVEPSAVRDATVLRVPKTYPAYFGTYARFGELRSWLDGIENLFLIGRNGMHKYNNQDHSMLTAMTAVDNIVAGRVDKTNLWSVNTEQEYHEHKAEEAKAAAGSAAAATA